MDGQYGSRLQLQPLIVRPKLMNYVASLFNLRCIVPLDFTVPRLRKISSLNHNNSTQSGKVEHFPNIIKVKSEVLTNRKPSR